MILFICFQMIKRKETPLYSLPTVTVVLTLVFPFSREKIRPDKELERAGKEILNCKLGLRDAVRQLDVLSSVGSMEEKVMAPDGSIHHDHVKDVFIINMF